MVPRGKDTTLPHHGKKEMKKGKRIFREWAAHLAHFEMLSQAMRKPLRRPSRGRGLRQLAYPTLSFKTNWEAYAHCVYMCAAVLK